MNKYIITILLGLSITACTNDAPDPVLIVKASDTSVVVGEPVTLEITHALDGLTVFAGDKGHDYYQSAHYILQGKTNDELQDNVFRPLNPDVVPLFYDFADAEPGARTIGNGTVKVVNATSGVNLCGGKEAAVKELEDGSKALWLNSTRPDWWYLAMQINPKTELGSNTKLTLTMHFEKDYLSDVLTGEERRDHTTFGVVIYLSGRQNADDRPIFSQATMWDIYWGPSMTKRDYTVDLARIIPAWQTATGKEMRYLDTIQVLFTTSSTNNKIGYVGAIYIDQIKFGDYDYKPFDIGEALNLNAGPGTIKYTHVYDTPGEYELVVLGTTTSLKNQNGEYTSDLGDKISAEEFRYNRQMQAVKISVVDPTETNNSQTAN